MLEDNEQLGPLRTPLLDPAEESVAASSTSIELLVESFFPTKRTKNHPLPRRQNKNRVTLPRHLRFGIARYTPTFFPITNGSLGIKQL